jgi:hypothetical protein
MALSVAPIPTQNLSGVIPVSSAPTSVTASPQYYGSSLPDAASTGIVANFSQTPPAANNAGTVIPTTSGGGSGNGSSGGITPQQQAKIDALVKYGSDSQLQVGIGNGQSASTNYSGQAGQLFNQVQQGQRLIDEARKNAGVSQINSIKDLMQTIRQGINGQGVNLASTNALDSSASGAVGRAYANYGNVETNKINNSAATANSTEDVAQQNLDTQRDVGMTGLKAFRDNAISNITTEAQKNLDGLRQTIAIMGGDGSKVDVEGIKQQILDNAQQKLADVDGYIQNTVGGVKPTDRATLGDQAYTASNAGVIPSGPGLPFQLNPGAPTTPANLGGASNSLIPFALKPKTAV